VDKEGVRARPVSRVDWPVKGGCAERAVREKAAQEAGVNGMTKAAAEREGRMHIQRTQRQGRAGRGEVLHIELEVDGEISLAAGRMRCHHL
jgi:hypothetical protein